jgi:thiol-disulfide isomerase/thioredoxin
VWYGVGAIVVVAAIIAVVASSGGSDKKAVVPAGVKQTRPVTVTGTPLPTFAGNPDPAVGQKAPTLHGKSFDGKPVAVTPGRPTLVLFVAHWCPHCQREVPLLAKYLKAHPLPAGLDMVTVATATSSADPNYPPSAWLARSHWPTPVMADSASGTAANAYGLPAFPYFVALDSSGKVVGRTSGEITTDQFAKLATGALKGQVVNT